MTTLFDPLQLGDIRLANRIVMAPLTRDRAGPGRTPHALNAEYYAQRSDPKTGAGLIISEGTQVDALGQGYLDTPGVYSPEQLAGWRLVTDAVHARGAETGSKPAGVKVLVWAGLAVDDTGTAPAGSSEVCEMRPTCQIWATILPPRACTASVTRRQPASCSGL